MRKTATFLALLMTAFGAAGCAKGCAKTPAGSASDADASAGASTEASAKAAAKAPYTGPIEAHLVARTFSQWWRLSELTNGKLVLDAGVFVFEVDPDGTLHRLGDVASYGAIVPVRDDRITGYDVDEKAPFLRQLHSPKSGGLLLVEGNTSSWLWDGKSWTEQLDGERDAGDGGDPFDGRTAKHMAAAGTDKATATRQIDLPPDISLTVFRRAADGTGVVIGQGKDANDRWPVSVIYPPGARAGKLVRFDGHEGPHGDRTVCQHVASWSRPHVKCTWHDTREARLYRLAGERWERVAVDVDMYGVEAVGPDGALWLAAREAAAVTRLSAAGSIEKLVLPKANVAASATYEAGSEYVQRAAADAGADDDGPRTERWEQVFITQHAKATATPMGVRQIVPRADGEAFAVGDYDDGSQHLLHLSRPAIAPLPEPTIVGSVTDQRNEIRNTRPTNPWVTHCALMFVPLARQRADGSFDSARVWEREKQLGALVNKAFGPPNPGRPSAAVIEGRLGGRRVAGVLVWRQSSSEREDLVEKAVNALVSDAASGGPPTDVTCTAPVLERASIL